MTQFTEEEARKVFARAAEHEHAIENAPPSLSRSELEAIGLAAGLSPESLDRAITEIQSAADGGSPEDTFWDVPTTVRTTRVLPGELTDELWSGMVSGLRRTFDSPGVAAAVGTVREWTHTNSAGSLSNLTAVAEPVSGGTRVTLETSRATEARQTKQLALWAPPTLLAVFGILGALQGRHTDPTFWSLLATILALGALIPIISRVTYARWSAKRESEFDLLLDQFEQLARSDVDVSSSTEKPSSRSLRLALDEQVDVQDAALDATRSRTHA